MSDQRTTYSARFIGGPLDALVKQMPGETEAGTIDAGDVAPAHKGTLYDLSPGEGTTYAVYRPR